MTMCIVTGFLSGICVYFISMRIIVQQPDYRYLMWGLLCALECAVQKQLCGTYEPVLWAVCIGIRIVDDATQLIPDAYLLVLAGNALLCGHDSVLQALPVTVIISVTAFVMKKITGQQCLGEGDIILLGIFGLYLSFQESMVHLLLSSCMALVSMKLRENSVIAFGPSLCLCLFPVLCMRWLC